MKINPANSAKTLKSSADLLSNIGKGEANAALRKPKVRHGAQNRSSAFDQAVRDAGRKNDPAAQAADRQADAPAEPRKTAETARNDRGGSKSPQAELVASQHEENKPVDNQVGTVVNDKQSEADRQEQFFEANIPVITSSPLHQASVAKAKAEDGAEESALATTNQAAKPSARNNADEEWVQRITGQAMQSAGAVMRQLAGAKSANVTAAAQAGMTTAGTDDAPGQPAEIPFGMSEAPQSLPAADAHKTPALEPVFASTKPDTQPTPAETSSPARAAAPASDSSKTTGSTTAAAASPIPDGPVSATPAPTFSMNGQAAMRLTGSSKVAVPQAALAHSRDLPDQAAHALTVALHDLPAPAGERIVTMRLNPVTMGHLRIELHVAGDAVAVQFHVGSPKARAALSKSMGDLKSSVERQGLRVESMDVQEDRALAAPDPAKERASADQTPLNPDGTGGQGGSSGRDHAGSPFANAPRSIAGAEPPALHPGGDRVASSTPGADEDGVLEILTYRLDAVA